MKIMYNNINGVIPRKLELTDYIREKEPDIICLQETKLSEDTEIKLEENNIYTTWRKARKGKKGGGVMIMTK